MATVLQKDMWQSYKQNVTLNDMETYEYTNASGKLGATVLAFPAQGEYAEPVKVIGMEHSLLAFSIAAAEIGASAEQLQAEYPEMPEDIAKIISDDISVYRKNYAVLYEPLVVCITAGFNDLFAIQPKPEESPEPVDAEFTEV